MRGVELLQEVFCMWEYKIMDGFCADLNLVKELNKLGAEGWEVCGTFFNNDSLTAIIILKRPKKY